MRIERVPWIAPVWRPLVKALGKVVPVQWEAPAPAETSWFGDVKPIPLHGTLDKADIVSCADPHHEAVEALRWVRKLLSMKLAKPSEIAFAAAAPGSWDEHFLALAANTGLRIHFYARRSGLERQRRPALRCRRGCSGAWLKRTTHSAADRALLRRRHATWTSFRRLACGCCRAALRSSAWMIGSARSAACGSTAGRAMSRRSCCPFSARLRRDRSAAREAGGAAAAGTFEDHLADGAAGRALPRDRARAAKHSPRGRKRSGRFRRVGAGRASCGIASALGSAPRPYQRALAARRNGRRDPAGPHRSGEGARSRSDAASRSALLCNHRRQRQRRPGPIARAGATRKETGSAPSPLIAAGPKERALARARIPEHAFSEPDRLMARP